MSTSRYCLALPTHGPTHDVVAVHAERCNHQQLDHPLTPHIIRCDRILSWLSPNCDGLFKKYPHPVHYAGNQKRLEESSCGISRIFIQRIVAGPNRSWHKDSPLAFGAFPSLRIPPTWSFDFVPGMAWSALRLRTVGPSQWVKLLSVCGSSSPGNCLCLTPPLIRACQFWIFIWRWLFPPGSEAVYQHQTRNSNGADPAFQECLTVDIQGIPGVCG